MQKINYLRISVTDRCNMRCVYCIPRQGKVLSPREEILTLEEIIKLAEIFASLGIEKIRLTGGEPLVRKGILYLVQSLSNIEGIKELSLTTNGALLSFYAERLRQCGLSGINVSLDTLDENKFRRITRMGSLHSVLEGLDMAKKCSFSSLKLNTVIMKGINDEEIVGFVRFALEKGLILRFIEFMKVTPIWKERHYFPIEKIKELCSKNFSLKEIEYTTSGPARYYSIAGGVIGFIRTSMENCNICSRLRLTSIGELKLCLYQTKGISLKSMLRKKSSDREIKDEIEGLIRFKKDISYKNWQTPRIYMCSVGG